jgi:hypothetical protein
MVSRAKRKGIKTPQKLKFGFEFTTTGLSTKQKS